MAAKTTKLILITGVTRGLGLAVAEKLIELGHTVLGCGRTAKEIEKLRRQFGTPHDFDTVDVAHEDEVKKWAKRLLGTHEAPNLLLNNAAVMNGVAPLWEVAAKDFDQIVDVNIKGVANVIRHFLPAMMKRKTGVIVNFSSGWGRSTSPEVAPYCCTKWAIEGLTRALAQELPSGMAAIPFNPGIIDTDMLRSCWGNEAGQYPTAKKWAEKAAPFLLQLDAKDNGKPLTAP